MLFLGTSFPDFLQLPSSSEAYPPTQVLEQLLNYQLGLWGAPREFYSQLHTEGYQPHAVQTTSVKISSVE